MKLTPKDYQGSTGATKTFTATTLRKKRNTSLAKMKEKAWRAFSKYIRFRAIQDDGLVICYTCGERKEWTEMQTGHWVEGHSNAVFINEDFVRPQCYSCNVMRHGNQGIFRDKIRLELGDSIVDDLLRYSKEVIPMTLSDYEELYKHYTRKFLELQ